LIKFRISLFLLFFRLTFLLFQTNFPLRAFLRLQCSYYFSHTFRIRLWADKVCYTEWNYKTISLYCFAINHKNSHLSRTRAAVGVGGRELPFSLPANANNDFNLARHQTRFKSTKRWGRNPSPAVILFSLLIQTET